MFRQAPSFPYHDLGIVEDGNTASRAISKDAFVIWKGSSYFASTDILQGATLEEDVNLTAIPDGVINGVVSALNNNLEYEELSDRITIYSNRIQSISKKTYRKYKNGFVQLYIKGTTATLSESTQLLFKVSETNPRLGGYMVYGNTSILLAQLVIDNGYGIYKAGGAISAGTAFSIYLSGFDFDSNS